jgi:hypothetical protein
MHDIGFILLLTAWSAGVGLRVLGRLRQTPEHPADALALAVPLGLGMLALAALVLGEFGVLTPGGLKVVLVAGALLGGHEACRGMARLVREASFPHPRCPDLPFLIVTAAVLVGTLLTALTPVTDGDALCYHLQVPKLFLERGAVAFEPDLHETIYPLVTELLYAVALTFRGPVACRLVQWVLGLAFAANVTALARPSLGARAWWAGAIALLVPAVSNGMSAPLNDVALAAFAAAALACWSRFHPRPGARSAVATGLLTGLAMGVKYPALVLAGLIGKAITARTFLPDRGLGARFKYQYFKYLYAVTVLAIGGVWYLRAFVHTGNPVYPFFRQVFGGAGLDEVLDPIKRPMAVTAWNLLTALGPMTLQPDRFDSFSHQLGPVFLLFLPGLLLEKAPRRVLEVAVLGYGCLMICVTQRQSMRFVLMTLGPMAVAVAWLASTWWDRRSLPGRILVGILLATLGFEASLAVARARHGLGVVLGLETAEQFLDRREPTFRVGRWIGANLPGTARIVGQDHRGFYIPRPYTMELAHRRRTGLGRGGESASEVVARLRESGFTHVLLCPPVPETAVEFDPTLGRLLAPWLEGRRPRYREEIADADGIARRYAIFGLAEDERAVR